MIRVSLNGEAREFDVQTSLQNLADALDLQGRRFAVELNKEIVPKTQHQQTFLKDGDEIEIVQAIGGG